MNSILITDCKDCIETHDIQQKPKLYPPPTLTPMNVNCQICDEPDMSPSYNGKNL